MVDQDAFAAEHEQKTAIAKTPSNRRQLTQLGSDGSVIRPHTEVSHRGPIRPDHFTRPPLTDLKTRTKVSHRLPPCDGRHHFFELRSFNMALSSIASASSFFIAPRSRAEEAGARRLFLLEVVAPSEGGMNVPSSLQFS